MVSKEFKRESTAEACRQKTMKADLTVPWRLRARTLLCYLFHAFSIKNLDISFFYMKFQEFS